MSTGKQKLQRDLTVLEAMAAEMEEYLRSAVLFWQMMGGGLPRLTLGGYLMRQHRLLALRDLLDGEEQARLDTAVRQFNLTLIEKIVRLEQKAHRELGARLRQWGEYLKDWQWETSASAAGYGSAVETRAMIAAITDKLQAAPYRLDRRIPPQIALLDANLRHHWQPGDFVWPPDWQPAYPQPAYWWLYGQPKKV